jgi:hypothetical protein
MATFDLAARRLARQQARMASATREGTGEELRIDLGAGAVVAAPPELPLWVLQPFLAVSSDVATLLYQVVQLYQGEESGGDSVRYGLALIAENAAMPQQLIDAVCEAARRLLGDDGYTALVEARLSINDVAELARALIEHYGVVPGESSASSASAGSGGQTSRTTSTTEVSPPATSGGDPGTQSDQDGPASVAS